MKELDEKITIDNVEVKLREILDDVDPHEKQKDEAIGYLFKIVRALVSRVELIESKIERSESSPWSEV